MDFPRIKICSPPKLARPGYEGVGEGIERQRGGDHFYYRVGKHIPKDKVTYVTWEGNYLGRQRGEKIHLLVVWDGEGFIELEEVSGSVLSRVKEFRGLTAAQAVEKLKEEQRKRQEKETAERANWPKCARCDEPFIRLDDANPDLCCECRERYYK